MLRNYLLVAVRNLLRNPAISFIHITGFGLGLAAFIFTMQAVVSEYSFDSFHKNGDKIYRIMGDYTWPDGTGTKLGRIEPALAPLLKNAIPELTRVARYFKQGTDEPYCAVTYTDATGEKKSFNEPNAIYVDEEFLKIFQFPIIQGNRNPLLNSSGMVMTRSCARRYFGDENPVGKIVELTTGSTGSNKTKFNYQVEAILEEIPPNSTLQFDILLPFRSFEDNYKDDIRTNWRWAGGFYTFIETQEKNIDIPALESKINETVPKSIRSKWASIGTNVTYQLQKLSDFHLNPNWQIGLAENRLNVNNKSFLLILLAIGLAILAIAEMNYISLTTAKALKKLKEVSVRKIVGASRKQLVMQFLVDALLHMAIGLAFALTLLQVARTSLAQWLNVTVVGTDYWNYLSLILIVVFIGSMVVTGALPAYYLSRVLPASALKGKTGMANGGVLRKFLVIFQFCASFVLICFTYVITSQLTLMKSTNTGISMDQRIAIRAIGTEDFEFKKFKLFKTRTENSQFVLSTSAAASIPGYHNGRGPSWSTAEKPGELVVAIEHVFVDFDYMKTLNIPVILGRDFTEDRLTDERTCLINETGLKYIGVKTPAEAIGKSLYFHWVDEKIEVRIIGVVGDTNFMSTGARPEPTVFTFANTVHPFGKYRHYVLHLAGGNLDEAIGNIKNVWEDIFPDAPFEFFFLDQGFQRVFEQEEKMQAVATTSSVIAIFIACMGLAGLVAYSVSQRVKEIGIRKTLGASVSQILMMLYRDFLKPIFISIVLGVPIASFAGNLFLENYENRIQLSVLMFLIPCLSLLMIAMVAVGYQTLMAAKGNPVDALKQE